jgi:acetyltransferase-like isoleucine patch superfamily enzyme
MISDLIVDIKRERTPVHGALKSLAKRMLRAELPAPKALFLPAFHAHQVAKNAKQHVLRVLVYQPMFRARCEEVGDGLYMYQGLPYIGGDLKLRIGKQCKISAQTSLVAGHVYDRPTLTLGDHTNLGPGVVISVSKRVTIGSHVRVGSGVSISDNPGHPEDPVERRSRPVDKADVRPVVIEDDVWLCTHAKIMPGVRIGKGAIVAAGAIVTRDVPPMTIVAGAPARVVRRVNSRRW